MKEKTLTQDKLTALGFGDVLSVTIARTCQKMHREIEQNPKLAEKVLAEIRESESPNPVDPDNLDLLIYNWVSEQADALHRDYTKAVVAPFKAVGSLFD